MCRTAAAISGATFQSYPLPTGGVLSISAENLHGYDLAQAALDLSRTVFCFAAVKRARDSNRETVAGWILNNLAASAAVFSPLETIRVISPCCSGESFGGRPPIRPFWRADSKPALVRSRSMAFSNSANAPSICIIIRPAGVVVSIA